jgi:hypothetical protein
LDLRGANDHLESRSRLRGGLLSPGRRGGLSGGLSGGYLHQLGGSSSSLLSFWCQVLHRHRRWDVVPLGLSACRQEDKRIIVI